QALHRMTLEKGDPRDLTGTFKKPGPVWMENGKPNSYGFIVEWIKVKEQWEKKTLFHPLMGMIATPRAFQK
ncbi:MAG: hypothetical protein QXS68_08470, partial [Candidatus Methanomethylicaceae archaeon]